MSYHYDKLRSSSPPATLSHFVPRRLDGRKNQGGVILTRPLELGWIEPLRGSLVGRLTARDGGELGSSCMS